jgi:hypothetical protein
MEPHTMNLIIYNFVTIVRANLGWFIWMDFSAEESS